jgi:hypothetical protein
VGAGGRSYTFDQREEPAGWLWGDEGRILYRPAVPLEDGTYHWRIGAWNGVEWVDGAGAAKLRIDATPPADVEELTVHEDPTGGRVILEWLPVGLDRRGRPEYVARYHVYRYTTGPFPPLVRAHELGSTPEPRFVDDRPLEVPILFYRVTAEDEAGNEPGRPD